MFAQRPETGDEWEILKRLHDLPSFMLPTRLWGFPSRQQEIGHAVYRMHPRGWDDQLYVAKTRSEAEELLAFLQQDNWNAGCYIGAPENPKLNCEIHEGSERRFVGAYGSKTTNLRFACDVSFANPGKTYFVGLSVQSARDVISPMEYVIIDGYVRNGMDEK